MSLTQLLFTVLTVLSLAVGQILFKLAARAMSDGVTLLQATLFNGWLWVSLVVYGLATITWIALLRQLPLNLAYPFVALAFVFVPLLGWWWLGEPLRWQNMAGAALILAGVWVSVGVK
ncbi:EamA family transporter [uncultured Xylophilus sp.]|uniref:EamA family transporter n=1 Tax=uncultured Xylophilus sp. TaxID=296832 RepID=UPI0025F83A57|nr:EamA family transporter [uncultured Xylophilus sp.]